MDEHKLRIFYEKRMGTEVEADQLGDEWKGYILKIAGGNDKQGFPMKQGVLTHSKYIHFNTESALNFDAQIVTFVCSPCSTFVEEGTFLLSSPSYRWT